MTVQWQKVHDFISSTFNDMHAERDYLVKRIFPELADWCERRKLRLVDVDLRWGVNGGGRRHGQHSVQRLVRSATASRRWPSACSAAFRS